MIIRDGEYLTSTKVSSTGDGEFTYNAFYTSAMRGVTISTDKKINGQTLYLTINENNGNCKFTKEETVWRQAGMLGSEFGVFKKGDNYPKYTIANIMDLPCLSALSLREDNSTKFNSYYYTIGYDTLDQITDSDGTILSSALFDLDNDPETIANTKDNFPTREKYTDSNVYINSATPVKKGCKFLGWSTSANGNVVYQPGDLYDVNQDGGNVTLYAKWTAWKHTVHYNANGGDQNSVPTDQTKTFDQAMILSDKKPTRHGYNFVRWNTKADGTGTSYEVKGNYNHDQNGGTVTLYAIWTPWVHTVHYDANGGDQSSVPNDQKKTYGQSMNVATKVPTRNEYKFLGWTTGKDGSGTFYNPGDAYYHDQNGQTVTLYAKWIQLYTVKYDGNQPAIKGVTVTGSVANQTQGQDESVNLRTNNFKNDSGVYKDWSVGKDAYKYGKLDGKIREFIHPEGFKTNHSTMQNEYTGYEGQIKLIHS